MLKLLRTFLQLRPFLMAEKMLFFIKVVVIILMLIKCQTPFSKHIFYWANFSYSSLSEFISKAGC